MKQYRYFTFFAMLAVTVKISTIVLIYKMVMLGSYYASAATLIMPLWFVLGDIIAEVYGFKLAKQVIYGALICQLLFAFACYGTLALPTPPDWAAHDSYVLVLSKLPRAASASFIAILIGSLLNTYLISRTKILFAGRYFWLRSLLASMIGEFIFTFIAFIAEFWGVTSTQHVFQLILISLCVKAIMNPLFILPASLLTFILKERENSDPEIQFVPPTKITRLSTTHPLSEYQP